MIVLVEEKHSRYYKAVQWNGSNFEEIESMIKSTLTDKREAQRYIDKLKKDFENPEEKGRWIKCNNVQVWNINNEIMKSNFRIIPQINEEMIEMLEEMCSEFHEAWSIRKQEIGEKAEALLKSIKG